MATYTTNGGIKLIATGDESGTWGSSTNTNFDIIDVLTNGVGTIDLTSAAGAYTLTTTNGVVSPGMDKVLIFTNATQAVTVTIAPDDAEKLYCVKNSTSYTLSFKQTASGTPVDVAAGATAIIAADGGGGSAVVTEIVGATSLGATFLQRSQNLNDIDDAGAARLALGLGDAATATIGTGVQAYDAGLQSISGLTTAADKMIYTTGSDTYAVTALTAAGRNLLDDADAAAQRTTLGLEIGTDVQAYNAGLADIAGITKTDGIFIVANGTNWIGESGSTARDSLGLGTLATQNSVGNSDWSGGALNVGNGGTGLATAPTNGQLLIGNGVTYTQATLTEGDNITITNTSGGIELDVVRNTTVGQDFSNSVRDAYINLTGGSGTSQVSTTNFGIGTYIFAWDVLYYALTVLPGETVAGSGLSSCGFNNNSTVYTDGNPTGRRYSPGAVVAWHYSYTHSGTWRCMGYAENFYAVNAGGAGCATLWMRIL
jgi:hypothetical protein